MKRRGFSLVDLMVAIFLGGLILTIMAVSMTRMGRVYRQLSEQASASHAMGLVARRLETDLQGCGRRGIKQRGEFVTVQQLEVTPQGATRWGHRLAVYHFDAEHRRLSSWTTQVEADSVPAEPELSVPEDARVIAEVEDFALEVDAHAPVVRCRLGLQGSQRQFTYLIASEVEL